MATLKIVEGPGEGQMLELGERAVLGRARDSDLQMKDPISSREHAYLYLDDDGYHVKDLGSSNGTLVNGERIDDRLLKSGDRIEVASVVMEFIEEGGERPDRTKTEGPEADAAPGQAELEGMGYRVIKGLGREEVARTFLAMQQAMDRPVVVQLIEPEFCDPPDPVLAAIRRASQIEHPAAVAILSAGTAGDRIFMARQPAFGQSTWSQCGKMSADELIEIGCQMAGLLAESHERSVVHGSLRPDRIVRTPKGHIKLLGLGLPPTRVGELSTEPDPQNRPNRIAYMAPERLAGGPANRAADIYSLGAVFYHLLCGQTPFVGMTEAELAPQISTQNVKPISELRPETPGRLADLIEKMLARNPAERPPSMLDVAIVFEELRGRAPAGTAPPRPAAPTAAPRARPQERRFFDVRTIIIVILGALLLGTVFLLGRVTGERFLRDYSGADRPTVEREADDEPPPSPDELDPGAPD